MLQLQEPPNKYVAFCDKILLSMTSMRLDADDQLVDLVRKNMLNLKHKTKILKENINFQKQLRFCFDSRRL